MAQKEFSEELGNVDRARIRFFIIASIHRGTEERIVRISEGAWQSAVARLLRGEIIDLELRPDPNAPKGEDKNGTPLLLEVPGKEAIDPARRRSFSGNPAVKPRKNSPTPSSRSATNKKWFGL